MNAMSDGRSALPGFQPAALLKQDLLGRVERGHSSHGAFRGCVLVRRDAGAARFWARPLARSLARREARALAALAGLQGIPRLIAARRGVVLRGWIEGRPMQQAHPQDRAYFTAALRLLAAMHRRGVTHNDLAKEPNWLVDSAGRPALLDFQLASVTRSRGWWFRLKAREDLRHLAKHKRSYCPQALSPRERNMLARPAWPARLWRWTGKPLYRFATRTLLGWQDREGAGDRGAGPAGSPPGGKTS